MATSNEQIRDDLIQHQVDLMRFARGMAARLVRLYNRAEPSIREELRRRFERIASRGGDIGPTVTKRLQVIEAAYAELMRPSWSEIADLTRGELNKLASLEVAAVIGAVDAALPVVIDMQLPNAAQLRQIVTHAPINGSPLRDWLSAWERNDRRRVGEAIRTGLLFSETPVQVSRRVFGTRALNGADGARAITRRGAQTIANTAMSAVANAVREDIYGKNADVISREVYVATLDSRTTPICRSLDGNTYPVGKGPRPPLHINCRSLRVPTFKGDRLGTRPANEATERRLRGLRGPERRRAVEKLVGRVPAKTTYQQWLETRAASFQDEVLGPTRGRLFRRADITLDRFVDETGRQYTIDELRARLPASAFERAGL